MPGASYTPRLFMPTKRFSTMSIRPMPLRPPIAFNWLTISSGESRLPSTTHRHARREADRHRLRFIGSVLRRNRHAEVDQLDAVDRQVFQPPGFVADVQAVLVGAVGLGDRSLDRDLLLFAVGDHLAAAGKPLAEFFHPPRRDHPHRRIERLGRQLKAALVVSLARGAVGVGVGADFAGHLQADFRNQRPGDRGAQQVNPLILGLPLEDWKGEVATQLLAGVDDAGTLGSAGAGLGQRGLAVLAGLAQVDVDRVDLVALVLQPAEDDRSVQSSGIG